MPAYVIPRNQPADQRLIVVKFPTMARAFEWYRSQKYAKALAIRDQALRRRPIELGQVEAAPVGAIRIRSIRTASTLLGLAHDTAKRSTRIRVGCVTRHRRLAGVAAEVDHEAVARASGRRIGESRLNPQIAQ
jgi:hypothetical protein